MCSCTIAGQDTAVWRGPLVISCRKRGASCQGSAHNDRRSCTALSVSVPQTDRRICRPGHESEKICERDSRVELANPAGSLDYRNGRAT